MVEDLREELEEIRREEEIGWEYDHTIISIPSIRLKIKRRNKRGIKCILIRWNIFFLKQYRFWI